MWRVARRTDLSGDASGATDVDPAGGLADADLRAPAATPLSVVNAIAQFNGTLPASFERGVSAMMQIMHDIAPAADLAFYTADISEQNFADGIIALADAGCNIICDDFTYDDEPFFQTGVVANAIQQVVQRGVIFVTCAGNQGVGAYQAAWSNIASTTYGGQTLTNTLNFGTAANPNPVQTITLRNDVFPSPMPLILEWNQPYGMITSNLALVVFQDGNYVGTYDNTNDDEPRRVIHSF